MEDKDRQEYLKAYYDNEASANKHMSIANAFAGALLFLVWFGYLFRFFNVHEVTRTVILILLPTLMLICLSPLLFVFFSKKSLRKKTYKFFVIFSFILVVSALSVVVSRHAIMAWALIIIMVNHYYNPKFGRIVFGVCLFNMLICIYASMFVGEYDPQVLGTGVLKVWLDDNGNPVAKNVFVDGIKERYQMLHQMLLNGDNRYLKALIYYYMPRALIFGLIFFVSNTLNVRTYKLLVKELHVSSEQQKTKTELEVAKEIQINTLPVEIVQSKDVEIQAELKAAKEVGGDFYDYYRLDKDHVAILIADVSGKGIPAAMLMMKTITCFKNYMDLNKTPSQIMKQVNKTIFEGNDAGMFVTAFLAILDTKTGVITYTNAGHNFPLVGQYPNFKFLKCNAGFVLGGLAECPCIDETYQLEHGDQITLYTDGISEAMNNKREQYGLDRFLSFANKKEYSCLLEFHAELKDDLDRFTQGAEQSDDITYITLKYHGDDYTYREKTYKSDINNIPTMLKDLKAFGIDHGFEEAFLNNLQVVGDELFSNIIKYGYKDNKGDIYLRMLYNKVKKEFILTIIDFGIEFDPFEVENKAIDENYKERQVGGLGVLIVKKLMSEYAYDRVNGKNIITLKKEF